MEKILYSLLPVNKLFISSSRGVSKPIFFKDLIIIDRGFLASGNYNSIKITCKAINSGYEEAHVKTNLHPFENPLY